MNFSSFRYSMPMIPHAFSFWLNPIALPASSFSVESPLRTAVTQTPVPSAAAWISPAPKPVKTCPPPPRPRPP